MQALHRNVPFLGDAYSERLPATDWANVAPKQFAFEAAGLANVDFPKDQSESGDSLAPAATELPFQRKIRQMPRYWPIRAGRPHDMAGRVRTSTSGPCQQVPDEHP